MRAADTGTVEGLFSGRPESLLLFHTIRQCIESLGPVTIEATGTQVSFGAARKFAWVWLPQLWIRKRPDTSITLTFALDRRIPHDRIEAAVKPYPGRWTHHVIIRQESDLDEDVRGWIREAHAFGQRTRSRNRKL